jgi:hypothetical protein
VTLEVDLFRDGQCVINLGAKIPIQHFQRGFTSVQSNIIDAPENLIPYLPHAGQMWAPSSQNNLVCSASPSAPTSALFTGGWLPLVASKDIQAAQDDAVLACLDGDKAKLAIIREAAAATSEHERCRAAQYPPPILEPYEP